MLSSEYYGYYEYFENKNNEFPYEFIFSQVHFSNREADLIDYDDLEWNNGEVAVRFKTKEKAIVFKMVWL